MVALTLVPFPAAAARRAAAVVDSDVVSVGVASITPLVLKTGGTLRISGVLTNTGTAALTNLNIELRVSTQPVGSRSELASLAVATARPPGYVLPNAVLRPAAPLPGGGRLAWTLKATAAELGFAAPGVYPVAVEVVADDPTTGGRTRFGTARTFLPWDLGSARPTQVAVVWPVLGTPSRDASGKAIGTTVQDELDGRLGTLLAAAGGSHLTWMLDGDTLESVRQLADSAGPTPTTSPTATPGTPSAGTPSTATAGTPSTGAGATSRASPTASPSPTTSATPASAASAAAAKARHWLDLLESAVATGEVLAVPFGDPDLVATVRAGRAEDVSVANTLGSQVVSQVLDGSVPVGNDVAWPADGTADSRTLGALPGVGDSAVLLSGQFTTTVHPITTYTPSAVGPLRGTPLTAAVSDLELSTLLVTPPGQLGGPALARQRILAELAMVTAELPFSQRSVVLVPPRRWAPDVTYIRGLLDALGQVPWVQPVTLGQLRAGTATGPVRQRPSYPRVIAQRELDTQQFEGILAGQELLDALDAIATDPSVFRDTYTRALLRSESTLWRSERPQGLRYIHAVGRTIGAEVASVRVVQSGALTLAARSGKIPVTVENGLGQTVTVSLQVTANPDVRLTVTQPAAQTIPAGQSRTFEVSAEATTNGSVQLVVQLQTPGGQPYGATVTFPVQITGFGEVAQVVVGAAFALLAVALVVRVARAIRRGRRPGSPSSVRERAR